MKKFILLALLVSSSALAVNSDLKVDKLRLGKPSTPSADKVLEFNKGSGATNPKLKWSGSASKLQFSNDGTNFKALGSGGGGGAGGINLLADSNPDFDGGTTGYTFSTGGTLTIDSTTPLNGASSAIWTPSAAAQTLTTAIVNVTAGVQGGGCQASIFYRTDEAASPYSVQVFNASNAALAQPIVLQSLTTARTERLYFPCPTTGGGVQLKILSNATTAPTAPILLDDFYLGSVNTGSEVSQAVLYGTIKWSTATGDCTWAKTGATWAPFAADATCGNPVVTGNIAVNTSNPNATPSFSMPNAPAGNYQIVARGAFTRGASTNAVAFFRFNDGVTPSSSQTIYADNTSDLYSPLINGDFTYSSSGNRTINLEGRTNGTTATTFVSTNASGGDSPIYFQVFYYPTVSQTGYRVDTTAASWSGTHGGDCLWTTTSGSYVDPANDATCTFTTRKSRNFGSVVSSGASTPGITFAPPRLGLYQVTASLLLTTSSGPSTAAVAKLVDDTGAVIATTESYVTTNAPHRVTVIGVYEATSLAAATLKFQIAVAGGGTTYIGNGNLSAIEWTVSQLDSPGAMPVFPGNVTTGSSGGTRMEYAEIIGNSGRQNGACTSTPCTQITTSSSWISTATHTTTGVYSLALNSPWSSGNIVCWCNVTGGNNTRACNVVAPTAAGPITVQTFNPKDAPSTLIDLEFQIACMGPR